MSDPGGCCPRTRLEEQFGVRLRECPHPELGDVCAYLNSEDGFLNLRFEDSDLLTLGGREGRPAGRGANLMQLAAVLKAQPGTQVCPPLRFLWLHLESVLYWCERRPTLARRAFRQACGSINRIYEREPLAGDQEGLTGYRQLAQLASIASSLSSVDQTKWSGNPCRI